MVPKTLCTSGQHESAAVRPSSRQQSSLCAHSMSNKAVPVQKGRLHKSRALSKGSGRDLFKSRRTGPSLMAAQGVSLKRTRKVTAQIRLSFIVADPPHARAQPRHPSARGSRKGVPLSGLGALLPEQLIRRWPQCW